MSSTSITAIRGRRVWDSRGRPTVEAEITLAGGATGRAIAPAGASTGSGEALDKRDGGSAFGGYDVTGAVDAVNRELAPALLGMDARAQAALDARLIARDGTPQKPAWAPMRRSPFPWLPRMPPPRLRACRSGVISAVTRRIYCPCRKSRFWAAAPMPGGAWISRIFW